MLSLLVRSTIVLAVITWMSSPAEAATRTWTGTNSGSSSHPANWGGTLPVADDDLAGINGDKPAGRLTGS